MRHAISLSIWLSYAIDRQMRTRFRVFQFNANKGVSSAFLGSTLTILNADHCICWYTHSKSFLIGGTSHLCWQLSTKKGNEHEFVAMSSSWDFGGRGHWFSCLFHRLLRFPEKSSKLTSSGISPSDIWSPCSWMRDTFWRSHCFGAILSLGRPMKHRWRLVTFLKGIDNRSVCCNPDH